MSFLKKLLKQKQTNSRYANGGGYESICLGCGNGDGLMNVQEMGMSKDNRPT